MTKEKQARKRKRKMQVQVMMLQFKHDNQEWKALFRKEQDGGLFCGTQIVLMNANYKEVIAEMEKLGIETNAQNIINLLEQS
jgi:hypothetical protein